jgi:hypothetical protein
MRGIGTVLKLAVTSVGLALAAGPAQAQSWVEYQDLESGFAINFPGQPEIADTTYQSPSETALPARVFSVEDGPNVYKVTVVDFSMAPGEQHVAVMHATDAMRQRGEIVYEIFGDLDEVYGPQFFLVEPDGREVMATVVFYNSKLYIAEGSVAAGAAPPAQFQQSMMLLNPDGTRPFGAGENADRLARQRAFEEEQRRRELEEADD